MGPDLVFVAAVQDLAVVGVEDEPAQFVEGLAAVELAADAAPEGFRTPVIMKMSPEDY